MPDRRHSRPASSRRGSFSAGAAKPAWTLWRNLGSHWKTVNIDGDSRIASSVTSLGGELLFAAQTQTILASTVPHDRPSALDHGWMEAGMNEGRRSGLLRALFCVRLLEQTVESTPEKRLAFLVGAIVAEDADTLVARGILTSDAPVLIAGGGAGVSAAWQKALAQKSIQSTTLDEAQVEKGLLTGLRSIAAASTCHQAV